VTENEKYGIILLEDGTSPWLGDIRHTT